MARLEFFVVAESVSIDMQTNRASVFNILENFNPSVFPFTVHSISTMTLWIQEDGDADTDFQMVLKVTTPSGAEVELPTNFKIPERRHRLVNNLVGLTIDGPGDLVFEIRLNGEHFASHTVTVNSAGPSVQPE
ncbi:MAG: hypothetical protein AAFS02_04665 [Pseudomonadota bacterium]